MSVIRAFIAVSLSDEIYQGLDQTVEDLKSRLPNAVVRWVSVKNIHLTLKFLGDVSTSTIDLVKKALHTRAGAYPAFEIGAGSLGAFPSTRRPRVIWVGLSAPEALGALQRGVEAEMARLGYPPEERPFSPHLTIGRISRNAGQADLGRLSAVLESVRVGSLGTARVDTIHLFRSDLRPDGPIYSKIFSASLASDQLL